MTANKLSGEAGPSGEVAGFDCFEPGGGDWAAAGCMYILCNVTFLEVGMDVVALWATGKRERDNGELVLWKGGSVGRLQVNGLQAGCGIARAS